MTPPDTTPADGVILATLRARIREMTERDQRETLLLTRSVTLGAFEPCEGGCLALVAAARYQGTTAAKLVLAAVDATGVDGGATARPTSPTGWLLGVEVHTVERCRQMRAARNPDPDGSIPPSAASEGRDPATEPSGDQ